nr:Uncharacterised protein [Klebsiella pneumoniae]
MNHPYIDEEYEKIFGLNEETIQRCVEGIDILLPKKWSVTAAGSKNNYDHYERGEYLHIRDYQAAIAIVEKLYPEYSTAIKRLMMPVMAITQICLSCAKIFC